MSNTIIGGYEPVNDLNGIGLFAIRGTYPGTGMQVELTSGLLS
jgi:hypothetical protein